MGAQWKSRAMAAVLAAVLLGLLCAPGAGAADWRQVPAPGGQIFSLTVANATTWLAEGPYACCTRSFDLTEDGGSSWETVQIPGFTNVTVAGAAVDGSFRVVGRRNFGADNQEIQVFRIDAAGADPLGPVIVGKTPLYTSFAVSDDGATWVPHWDAGQNGFVLTVVAASGSVTNAALPNSSTTYGWEAQRTALGMRLLRFVPGTGANYSYSRGTFRLDGGQLLPAEAYPVSLAEGDWMLSSEFVRGSWDGGANWGEQAVSVIPRSPGLGNPRYARFGGGIVADRFSPSLFRGTSLSWPAGVPTNFVVDAGPLIAWGGSAIYVQEAALSPGPTALGNLQPDAQRLFARADVFRADAGLPPLTGDALISAASRNHSAYTVLHPKEAENSAHFEQPGLSGFTGVFPGDRCEAVGTSCNSEIMFSPGVADPVGSWMATIYHRPLIGSPEAGLVGGAEVAGGWAVMDGGGPENALVRPFGYPTGRWRGDEGFAGEIPDPVTACNGGGQPISYPIGIAVTLYLPNGSGGVSKIYVRRHGDPTALPGCLLNGYAGNQKTTGVFILDDPLVRGQAYDVSAVWNPGPDDLPDGGSVPNPNLSYDWSFYFEPDSYGTNARPKPAQPCRALSLETIKSVASPQRAGRHHQVLGIEEQVTLKQKAMVRLRRARLDYWTAGDRHSVKLELGKLRKRARPVARTSYLRFLLPHAVARRVIPGEAAELLLTFTGRRASGCARLVHVSRIRKVKIGWVRASGPAWVSGSARRHR
jgi:hypothetical protein